jgi:preprotein translocase subunit SecE
MKKPGRKVKKKKVRKSSPAGTDLRNVSNTNAAAAMVETEPKRNVQPIIAKRESDKRSDESRSMIRYINIAGQFLREAKMELKKVKWPTRKELLASTATVIVLVLIMAFYLGIIDFGLIKLIKSLVG